MRYHSCYQSNEQLIPEKSACGSESDLLLNDRGGLRRGCFDAFDLGERRAGRSSPHVIVFLLVLLRVTSARQAWSDTGAAAPEPCPVTLPSDT